MKKLNILFCGVFMLFLLQACGPKGAEDIQFGKDQCAFCKMTISNPNFGAELITDKGRVFKYDAAECMVNHLKQDDLKYRSLYTVAYDDPQKLYPVDTVHFIFSPEFRSPMGANLAAFSNKEALAATYRDQFIAWPAVMEKIGQ